MKKLLAILLCIAMLLSLAACGGGDKAGEDAADAGSAGSAGDAGSGDTAGGDTAGGDEGGGDTSAIVSAKDTLNVGITGDTGNLDACSGTFAGVVRQYRDPLFDLTADGETVWVLATNIEEVTDTEWVITLREGVKFSNGSDFNAKDVMYTLQKYFDDPMSNMYVNCLDLANSTIVDDYTINLKLSAYSMQQMGSLSMVYIIDAETYDAEEAVTNPIGTGPYVVDEYVMNSHVYLKPNEYYWGEKAKIENLHYIIMSEDAQMVNALQAGTVDCCSVPSQDVEFAQTLSDYEVKQYYTVFAPTIQFNLSSNSVFNNLDARLAVCYATNRQAMVDLAYFGSGEVLNYPVSEHSLDFNESLADLHDVYATGYNLEKAKEYAEKAGLVGKEITVITNGASAYVTEAEILQANLKEIGVTVKIDNYDAASYFSVSYDPTMYDIALYAVASPQCYAVGMLYEMVLWGAAAYGEWPDYAAYCELGAKAVATRNAADREGMLKDLSQMFVDGCLWYGICDQVASVAINKDLGGVQIWNSGTMQYYQWYWVE